MTQYNKPLLAVLGSLTLILAAPAYSQTATDDQNTQTFEPAFFTQYAPRTALDMVGQIPGFQLDGGDNKRGLGQGGANILINGERVTGKTDVGSALSRIPATNVVRVEIKDGASLNIPGLSGQVADFITKSTGISGTWSWAPQFRERQDAALGHFHLTVSGETENLSYSAELRNENFNNGNWGPESLFDAGGTVFETRDETAQYRGETPGASLDLVWKPKDDHIGNLNLDYNTSNFNERVTSKQTAVTARGQDLETLFSFAEDEWNAKIGADYEFPLAKGKLKTIAYYRAEHSPTFARFDLFDPVDGQTGGSRFTRLADEGEAILRSEYSWSPEEGRDWQIGVESAFNFLDIESGLLIFDKGAFVDEPLDGATSRVEEKRAEVTATHSRALSSKWDIQASLGAEYSQLAQTGGLERSFVRPKGFIAATYKPIDKFSIRTKLEREVGQLNFFDFISSVSVGDDFNTTGNINLVPEQSWLGEVEFDRDFGQGNTAKIRFYGSQITDLVDRIPIGVDGDAVGNIDEAKRYGVEVNATLKGDKWGFKGTQLDLQTEIRNSEVKDPLTKETRRLNNDRKYFWSLTFRHDIQDTDWAYGYYHEDSRGSGAHRLNTIDTYTFDGGFAFAFIEHKDFFGMKVNASLRNLLDSTDDFERQIFTNRRDQGVLDFTESRTRGFGKILNIEFSGTF